MLELRAIFVFRGKVGNDWTERTFLIRSFDSERALKLCRNIGEKNQCDSNYTKKNFCGESLSV